MLASGRMLSNAWQAANGNFGAETMVSVGEIEVGKITEQKETKCFSVVLVEATGVDQGVTGVERPGLWTVTSAGGSKPKPCRAG